MFALLDRATEASRISNQRCCKPDICKQQKMFCHYQETFLIIRARLSLMLPTATATLPNSCLFSRLAAEDLTERAGHLAARLLTVWFWTGASSLLTGTESHRKCFQCYFCFIKINSKLLKDRFSRCELEMAIISHACSASCCAELPRALQDISRQAAPSISETFTGCPARSS